MNQAPIAKANADREIGQVPLSVNFSGSNSSDDTSIHSYFWDFKDGSESNELNPSHIFNEIGIFNVELTVTDEQGLADQDIISVVVEEQPNEIPTAIASVNILSGEAPLKVDFTGSNSTDDIEISNYIWNFPDSEVSEPDTSYVFDQAGEFDITLTVVDNTGLKDSTLITITVTPENKDRLACQIGGGLANQTGKKVWCWQNIDIPSGALSGGDSFSNGELALSVECSENQVVNFGDQLMFKLNPISPEAANWCNNEYNLRSEIRTLPWPVKQSLGTEEWLGWSYTFGDNYEVDNQNPWLFFQMHQGVNGSPPFELAVVPSSLYGAENGEVVVINEANLEETDRTLTGFVPTAGTTLNIVVHVIHDLGTKGMLQVWINNKLVYDKKVGTVYADTPWGGNAKFGIYKWGWREAVGVQSSLNQGINNLETYMGPLRIITRKPNDVDYNKNAFNEVVPR